MCRNGFFSRNAFGVSLPEAEKPRRVNLFSGEHGFFLLPLIRTELNALTPPFAHHRNPAQNRPMEVGGAFGGVQSSMGAGADPFGEHDVYDAEVHRLADHHQFGLQPRCAF